MQLISFWPFPSVCVITSQYTSSAVDCATNSLMRSPVNYAVVSSFKYVSIQFLVYHLHYFRILGFWLLWLLSYQSLTPLKATHTPSTFFSSSTCCNLPSLAMSLCRFPNGSFGWQPWYENALWTFMQPNNEEAVVTHDLSLYISRVFTDMNTTPTFW